MKSLSSFITTLATLTLCTSIFSLNAATYTGKITYSDTVIGSSSTSQTTSELKGATVTLTGTAGTTETTTGTTDENGNFSIDNTSSTVTVSVSSNGSGILVGSTASGSSVTGVFSVDLGSISDSSPNVGTLNISDSSSAAPFNIFSQIFIGRKFLTDLSTPINVNVNTNVVYSSTDSTQYRPIENYIIIQNTSSDPDGFDDDIILHEFGHWVAENFSTDHSEGGFHTVTSELDLRLSWSEGLAHYISSAIRNNSTHLDFSTAGTSSFDIDSVGTSKGSQIEIAVSGFLWDISKTYGHNAVFTTLTGFRSLPSSISSDPISLDTFYDIWQITNPTMNISTMVSSHGMSYYTDAAASGTTSSPISISTPDSFIQKDLSFFSDGDKDYFSFPATSGVNYHIETGLIGNGALTGLNVYKGSTSNLVASNNQRSTTHTNSSYIYLEADESTNYIVEVFRFNSSTQNFGFDTSKYTRTVGRYGTYAVALTKATGAANPNSANHPELSFATTGASSTVTTVVTGSSGGGGGGCLLRRL